MEHFVTTFLFFYGPYHNATLIKIYILTVRRLWHRRLTRNSLILNELQAYFQKTSPPKSTPFSIILGS